VSASGEVSVGDVARALAALRPDDAVADDVARLLGHGLRPARVGQTGQGEGPVVRREPTLPEVSRRPVARSIGDSVSDGPRRPDVDAAARTLPWRRYLRPAGRLVPVTDGGGSDDAPGLPAETSSRGRGGDPEPLLRPSTTPRLIEAMVATDAGDGELDLDVLVTALAARRRLEVLPRRPHPSLLHGVQLLVDVAEAMAPYGRDAEQVAAAVRTTVGTAMVRRLSFSGTPLRGAGTGSAWTWTTYVPPPPGTPVLAVTELGMAPVPGRLVGPLQQSWLDLAELLSRRGSPLVVLTPFPPQRWPPPLVRALHLVHWDRSSTVARVGRAVFRPARLRDVP
jgi:hypothetical protein